MTGRPAAPGDFGREYWWRNVRERVRFADAVEDLIRERFAIFLEMSPHPVLAASVTETLLRRDHKAWVLSTLRRKESDHAAVMSALAALQALGARLEWDALYPGPAAPVSFPGYAWAHESFWHQTDGNRTYLGGAGGNPLLGVRRDEPADSWENEINVWMAPYLADHRIQGHILLPGTALLEMGMAAAKSLGEEGPLTLEDIRFPKALFLPAGDNVCLSTSYDPESLTFHIHARERERASAWQLHASGRIMPGDAASPEVVEPEALARRFAEALDSGACYRRFLRSGIEYGPSFRGIRRLWTKDGESLAEIELPASLRGELAKYQFHPAALDACLQALIGSADFPESKSYLPVSIDRLRVFGHPTATLWSHVRDARIRGDVLEASIRVLDDRGLVLAEIEGIRCQGVEDKKLDGARGARGHVP